MVAPNVAWSQGVLVVAAAGNDSQDAAGEDEWPCVSDAICVGAMDTLPSNGYATRMYGDGASYSNYGAAVRIWAPTNIHAMSDPSARTPGGLTSDTGTSASTPYVAGVGALMLALNPNLTPDQISEILFNTGTGPLTSEVNNAVQSGKQISPFDAVVAANGGKEFPPQIVITSPKNGAKVGATLYRGVTFKAAAQDIRDGNWPVPAGSQYAVGPIRWKSSRDGPMYGSGSNGGTSISYVFSPSAKPGPRTITATVTNSKGLSASANITVDYEPQIGGPSAVIVYPQAGARFQAGTIIVRGYAKTALSLGYLPCSRLVWQKGIATTPIPSTSYGGAESGLCEAHVPFKAGTQTLALTATDTTGKLGTATESLKIAPESRNTTVSIDDPAMNGQGYTLYFGQSIRIALHAFIVHPPSGAVTYTWSWFFPGASSNTAIGTGQSLSWNNTACGTIMLKVVVTSPSIPTIASPTATRKIQVTCSSSG